MRAKDIVNQLARYLPALVDDFTTNYNIISLMQVGGIATATTASVHGLKVGSQVNITGALTPISIVSIDRVGIVATLVTAEDHDMTENAGFDVQISGANEAEFNGTFKLLQVPNRRTIVFQVVDAGPISSTGSPILLNGSNPFKSYNGLVEVLSVPTPSSFTYNVDSSIFATASGTPIAKTNPRISAVIEYQSAVDAYVAQNIGVAWLFVLLGDSIADKNRNIDTDSTDNIQAGHYFNQRLIQSVQLFVILPSSGSIAGRDVRDRCEELLQPICKSILACKFPSLVENTNNPLMLTGHGLQEYKKAFYSHQFAFEATLQLGRSDTFVPSDDVAFRDIDLDITTDVGTETFNTMIDLDDKPIV